MSRIEYRAPASIDEAVGLLAEANGDARILAGGTDLLVQLRAGLVQPGMIVDIKNIPETQEIDCHADGITIGAAVSGAQANENAILKETWPGVLEAWDLIGSTQIQGRATLSGNLCNASPAADSVPAMAAAGARISIVGKNGRREVAVEEVTTGPGRTSLEPGEFVVSIHLPARAARSGDAYLRFIPRTEMDIAVVGAGVNLSLDDNGICTTAKVVLGAVAPTIVIVDDAAKALIGHNPDDAAALEALDKAAQAACNPIDDKRGTIEFRTKVAGVLARRATAIAAQRARSR